MPLLILFDILCHALKRWKETLELQFVKEHMNPGPEGQVNVCQTLPQTGFVYVLGRVKHRSHSDRELNSISLSHSVALYTSLCVPVSARWSVVKGRRMEGGGSGWGKVSISEPGSCYSAVECQVTAPVFVLGSFSPSWSSAELTGLLSDGRVDPGGIVEEHKGIETEREGDRQLYNRRAERVLPGPELSSAIYNKQLKTLIHRIPLPSLTSQFCWKRSVNKHSRRNASRWKYLTMYLICFLSNLHFRPQKHD